jgi:DNA polymerase type B, organellar and viral
MSNPSNLALDVQLPTDEDDEPESPYDAILRQALEDSKAFAQDQKGKRKKKFKGRPQSEWLLPTARRTKPFDPVAFDIESKAGPSAQEGFVRPFLAGIYDGTDFIACRNDPAVDRLPWRRRHLAPGGCLDKAFTILTHDFQERTIYAHNGGGFDFLFLPSWLMRQSDLMFEVVPVQSSMLRLSVWKKNSRNPKKEAVTFLDSMKLVQGRLDEACKAFGVPGKIVHNLRMEEDDPRWEEYLEGDCRALRGLLLRFNEMVDRLGGDVATTTPATAMLLFRQAYLDKTSAGRIERHAHFEACKDRVRCRGCLHRWIRESYKGGRVEILEMEGTHLRYYDINSSYPTALLQPMPVGGKIEEIGHATWEMAVSHGGSFVGFVECEVFIPPSCSIPPLPVQRGGKLIFPAGKLSGIWDADELALLDHPLVQGKVLSVKRAVWFKADKLFEPMIRSLYRYRQRSKTNPDGSLSPCECNATKAPDCAVCGFNEALSQLAKLIMNSFYGKFGMDPDREKIVLIDPDVKDARARLPRGSKPAWSHHDPDAALESTVFYAPEKADADYVVPQVAAHTTSLGRIRLWMEMAGVLMQGGRLFYVDTDAVLMDGFMESSPDLGRMKDEYPGKLLRFRGIQPKGYFIEIEGHDQALRECIRALDASQGGHLPQPAVEILSSLGLSKDDLKGNPDRGTPSWKDASYARKRTILLKALSRVRKVKFKGIPSKLRTGKNFDRLADGEVVSYERLGKVRSLAGKTDFWGTPRLELVTKSVRSIYDKRIVHEDGTTSPLVLEDGHVVPASRFSPHGRCLSNAP